MMKLKQLHEQFIDAARRPMTFGRLPINPSKVELPVIPIERWTCKKNPARIVKTYKFMNVRQRNVVLRLLLEYEEEREHCANFVLDGDTMTVELTTKNTDQVTEIDKEYARHADELFKDVMLLSQEVAHSH